MWMKKATPMLVALILAVAVGTLIIRTLTPEHPPQVNAWAPHVVQPGETLWGFAERAKTTNVPAVIEQIKKQNHLESSDIQTGELLLIPAEGGGSHE